jgi:hypothetical protein
MAGPAGGGKRGVWFRPLSTAPGLFKETLKK